jgi:hypothetical protein
VADKDKPIVTAPSESVEISTGANRPTPDPVPFRPSGQGPDKSALEQAANYTPSPQQSALQEAARRASRISRAPAPPPSISEGSSGYRPDTSAPLTSVRESIQRAARISDERDAVRDNLPPVPPLPPTPPRSDRPSGQPMHQEDGKFWVWLALWGAALVTTLGAGLALVFGDKQPVAGWILVGSSLAGMLLLTRWLINQKRIPSPFVIGGMIVLTWAFLAYGWLSHRWTPIVVPTSTATLTLCTDGPCAPLHVKPGPKYLKSIGLGGSGAEPLSLFATPSATSDRLRIFVDYSEYRSGWMERTRAFIGELVPSEIWLEFAEARLRVT